MLAEGRKPLWVCALWPYAHMAWCSYGSLHATILGDPGEDLRDICLCARWGGWAEIATTVTQNAEVT